MEAKRINVPMAAGVPTHLQVLGGLCLLFEILAFSSVQMFGLS